jgi:hypothetical protein
MSSDFVDVLISQWRNSVRSNTSDATLLNSASTLVPLQILHRAPNLSCAMTWRYRAHDTHLEVQGGHHLMLAVPDRPHTEFVLRNDMVVRTTRQEKTLPIEEIDAKG